MSLCLYPTAAILPSVVNDFFRHIDHLERTLCRAPARFHEKKLFGQLEKVVNDESKLAISLNVSNYKPDELKVNIDGRSLTVEGKQEIRGENGYSARSFVRQWTLPEEVDVEQIRSTITEDGHLSIEAPKAKPNTGRSIPIEKSGGSKIENSSDKQ